MKLSKAQQRTLVEAYIEAYGGLFFGWFCPQNHESAPVVTTHATCRALVKRGLLQIDIGDSIYSTIQYRITEAGGRVAAELLGERLF
jgi:hypothetical protein